MGQVTPAGQGPPLRCEQARKLGVDGYVLPWLVGTESCDLAPGGGLTGMRNRGWAAPSDTRVWSLVRSGGGSAKGGADASACNLLR